MNENPQTVQFATLESVCTRLERSNRRFFVIVLVLLGALIATNAGWIYYESQWQVVETTTTQTVTQDGGENRFIGGDYYGATNSDD